MDYNSLLNIENIKKFNDLNKENVSLIFYNKPFNVQIEIINKLFDYIYNKRFPRPNEYFSYLCPTTKIAFNYNYPTKYEMTFLPMEYLGPIFLKLLNPEIIVDFLFKILSEQSIIFVSDDLQNLTALV